jgi:hypothetical protein
MRDDRHGLPRKCVVRAGRPSCCADICACERIAAGPALALALELALQLWPDELVQAEVLVL